MTAVDLPDLSGATRSGVVLLAAIAVVLLIEGLIWVNRNRP